MKKVNLLIATILVTASVAFAGNFHRYFDLEPSEHGSRMNASGSGVMGQRGNQQYLFLIVNADVPDGTVLRVVVNNDAGNVTAGIITMQFGYGEFTLPDRTRIQQPRGVFPVTSIRGIYIRDEDGDVLAVDF